MILLRTDDVVALVRAAATGNGVYARTCEQHPRTAHALRGVLDAVHAHTARTIADPSTSATLATAAASLDSAAREAAALASAQDAPESWSSTLTLSQDASAGAAASRQKLDVLRDDL